MNADTVKMPQKLFSQSTQDNLRGAYGSEGVVGVRASFRELRAFLGAARRVREVYSSAGTRSEGRLTSPIPGNT